MMAKKKRKKKPGMARIVMPSGTEFMATERAIKAPKRTPGYQAGAAMIRGTFERAVYDPVSDPDRWWRTKHLGQVDPRTTTLQPEEKLDRMRAAYPQTPYPPARPPVMIAGHGNPYAQGPMSLTALGPGQRPIAAFGAGPTKALRDTAFGSVPPGAPKNYSMRTGQPTPVGTMQTAPLGGEGFFYRPEYGGRGTGGMVQQLGAEGSAYRERLNQAYKRIKAMHGKFPSSAKPGAGMLAGEAPPGIIRSPEEAGAVPLLTAGLATPGFAGTAMRAGAVGTHHLTRPMTGNQIRETSKILQGAIARRDPDQMRRALEPWEHTPNVKYVKGASAILERKRAGVSDPYRTVPKTAVEKGTKATRTSTQLGSYAQGLVDKYDVKMVETDQGMREKPIDLATSLQAATPAKAIEMMNKRYQQVVSWAKKHGVSRAEAHNAFAAALDRFRNRRYHDLFMEHVPVTGQKAPVRELMGPPAPAGYGARKAGKAPARPVAAPKRPKGTTAPKQPPNVPEGASLAEASIRKGGRGRPSRAAAEAIAKAGRRATELVGRGRTPAMGAGMAAAAERSERSLAVGDAGRRARQLSPPPDSSRGLRELMKWIAKADNRQEQLAAVRTALRRNAFTDEEKKFIRRVMGVK